MTAFRGRAVLGILPAFYEPFLSLLVVWVCLSTSWTILSGYAGYFSFGLAAFFGAGVYTTATLTAGAGMPFLWTLPAAGLVAALLGTMIAAVVFRVHGVRGELFALLPLAVTFVLSCLVVFFNLIADILYGWLDPRISYR